MGKIGRCVLSRILRTIISSILSGKKRIRILFLIARVDVHRMFLKRILVLSILMIVRGRP